MNKVEAWFFWRFSSHPSALQVRKLERRLRDLTKLEKRMHKASNEFTRSIEAIDKFKSISSNPTDMTP